LLEVVWLILESTALMIFTLPKSEISEPLFVALKLLPMILMLALVASSKSPVEIIARLPADSMLLPILVRLSLIEVPPFFLFPQELSLLFRSCSVPSVTSSPALI
jgi:hypothetical protein